MSEDVKLARRVFEEAMALAPEQRIGYLIERCGENSALRRDVETLLHAAADSAFLEPPGPAAAWVGSPTEKTAPSPIPRISIRGYAVIRKLSEGGQGVVYLAQQESTGRRVAIKMLRDGMFADPRSVARFDREAQLLAALNHPNIVTVLDRGTTGEGHPFLSMNFVNGKPLDEFLGWKHRSSPAAASDESEPDVLLGARLFLRICDAVNAAHLRGIVHRDLKPSNILVDERGEPHILDFGLARSSLVQPSDGSVDRISMTGDFFGSLYWASPEQVRGDPSQIDSRSDVYSLGVILYQIITGGLFPYELDGALAEKLQCIATRIPKPPSQALAESRTRSSKRAPARSRVTQLTIASTIEPVVLKALLKNVHDRYQSAGDLARDLGNGLAGLPIAARGRLASRRAAIAVGVLMATLSIAAYLTGRAQRTEPGRSDKGVEASAPRAALFEKMELIRRLREKDAASPEAVALQSAVSNSLGRHVYTNAIGMHFVGVTAGTFMMGSPESEEEHRPDERQFTCVISRPYYVGMTEVTQQQWARVMPGRQNPSYFTADKEFPVDGLLWRDANDFCVALSEMDGQTYRLPTEAEWEYACRAGSTTRFCNGDTYADVRKTGWVTVNEFMDLYGPARVATLEPNAWGIFDMHGNVEEYCADWYRDYPSGTAVDPSKPSGGGTRVKRGGTWALSPTLARSARRSSHPAIRAYSFSGMRVVLEMNERNAPLEYPPRTTQPPARTTPPIRRMSEQERIEYAYSKLTRRDTSPPKPPFWAQMEDLKRLRRDKASDVVVSTLQAELERRMGRRIKLNSAGMCLLEMLPGTFSMGSGEQEPERGDNGNLG